MRGWGVFVLVLLSLVIGGSIVYGVMRYVEQGTQSPDVPLAAMLPSSTPTVPPPLTETPQPSTTLPLTTTLAPAPTATNVPTPTLTASKPTEQELVINAFAECAGQYSGREKRFREQAADASIADGQQSVADIRAKVERHCGGVFPELLVSASQSANTPEPQSTPAPTPTHAPTVITSPTPAGTIPTPVDAALPNLRHIEEKRYMLELINAERAKAGLNSVVLGDNIAAQLHAESALENCFSSHWGIDGLKPYMRYSLAGDYQSNGENGSGLDYCIKSSDGYSANSSISVEINEAMDGWMNSSGHRRNLLDPSHWKVNIGIAWDRYNTAMYQHFEGDYVEYDRLPTIANGILSSSGTTKNGVRFGENRDLGIQIYYDAPPHLLTRGQVARTYCYDSGRQVAALREPLTGGYYWPTNEFTTTYKPCPSPYDVAADAPAPRSPSEAHQAWQQAYDASQRLQTQSITLPWITASEWTASGDSFAVKADISQILNRHGDGVYSLMVWGKLGGERVVISQYSIFYGVTPPDTYYPTAQ